MRSSAKDHCGENCGSKNGSAGAPASSSHHCSRHPAAGRSLPYHQYLHGHELLGLRCQSTHCRDAIRYRWDRIPGCSRAVSVPEPMEARMLVARRLATRVDSLNGPYLRPLIKECEWPFQSKDDLVSVVRVGAVT